MRRLLTVIDRNGKTKIEHFINTATDFEPDIAFLTDFIGRNDKLRMLEKTAEKSAFFSAKESSDFFARLLKGNKKETEYYLTFLDSGVGVEILNSLIESKQKELRFYSVRCKDSMFVENLYEINFRERLLKIYGRGRLLDKLRFEV